MQVLKQAASILSIKVLQDGRDTGNRVDMTKPYDVVIRVYVSEKGNYRITLQRLPDGGLLEGKQYLSEGIWDITFPLGPETEHDVKPGVYAYEVKVYKDGQLLSSAQTRITLYIPFLKSTAGLIVLASGVAAITIGTAAYILGRK